jgi:TonB family protein
MQIAKAYRWPLTLALLIAPPAAIADWEPSEMVGLTYPRLALMAQITGLVVVKVSVGSDGSVIATEAVSGHPLLAEAARKNAEQWKFMPSDRAHGPVHDPYLVYRFVMKGACAGDDCRASFVIEYPNFVLVTSEGPPYQASRGKMQ